MRSVNAVFALVIFVLGTIVSTSALAQRHHYHRHGSGVRLGLVIGPGFFYPPPYYYPYYPPRVIVAPAQPPTYYIERGSAQTSPALPQGYWYYCNESQAYYPYVNECPGGWQQVAPQPPG